MEDKELNKLKAILVPPPSPAAKRDAVGAARQVFEAANNSSISQTDENRSKSAQGFSRGMRLIHGFTQKLWSFIMKKRLMAGTAMASLLAITVTSVLWQGDLPSLRQEQIGGRSQPMGRVAEPKDIPAASVDEMEKGENKIATAPPTQKKQEVFRATISDAKFSESRVPAQGVTAEVILDDGPYYKGRDQFENTASNPVSRVSERPVSTFSIDVDTASYAFVRKSLNQGQLPPKNAVRVEELINYFDYVYPLPDSAEQPFKPSVAVFPTPWNQNTKLLHIGIKGYDLEPTQKPGANLVFLIDVSGSMNASDKLPLLKNAFRMMVENLGPQDHVSIVTYAGAAGTALEPTRVKEKSKIFTALEQLAAGGSTAGAQGIAQAYALAEQNFDKEKVNRVILATDGDFNVGITDRDELKAYIERKRQSGIFLSVLGFGQGNYNDALMQALAQNGNGNAAYIDTLSEARKVLVEEAGSTLFPIAKDVKIQIEFNPESISEYRLIGYETRMLKREDLKNDKVDAGDIGAGHAVTAIYELTPVGAKTQMVDDLRYQKPEQSRPTSSSNEFGFLKLRYKLPDENDSRLIELPIDKKMEAGTLADLSTDLRFAVGVAAFGQLLRADKHMGDFAYDDVIDLTKNVRGEDEFGYRSEFLNLVRLAKSIKD